MVMSLIVVAIYAVSCVALIVFGITLLDDEDVPRYLLVVILVEFVSLLVLLGGMAILLGRVDHVFIDKNKRLKRIATATNHELRTPLTLMLANLDVLEMEHGQDDLIDDMREETLHMTRLVSKMSELSRLEEGEYVFDIKDVDLSNLAVKCLAHFSPLFEIRGLNHVSNISEGVYCKADESEIKQIFYVLLDNALKYCDDKGTVEVSVFSSGPGYSVVCVENTFAACDPSEFKHFFERFYRSDASQATSLGDGLGLPLAALAAEQFGGTIKAYNAPERDAIGFRLALLR